MASKSSSDSARPVPFTICRFKNFMNLQLSIISTQFFINPLKNNNSRYDSRF